jgi:hypothetical protein
MVNYLLFILKLLKSFVKLLLWLILVFALVLFILWFAGKSFWAFDIGIDNFVLNIIKTIRSFLGF